MALSAWDKTRVFGTWYTHDEQRIPGTYKVTMPARVTVEAGEAIVPAGVYAQGDLNTSVDTAPALDVMVPSNDDPDVTPLGWQVVVEVTLNVPGGGRVVERYVIDTPVGGEVNLRTVVLAQTIPSTQTMLIRGVAGGVAALDHEGDVIDASGAKVTGGGGADLTSYSQVSSLADYPATFPADLSGLATVATTGSYADLTGTPTIPAPPTWATLSGKPAVIAAGTSQTAARSAIGAGTSNLQLGTGPTTAAAGDHTHSQYATTTALTSGLAGKADTGHNHPIDGITGLQDALDGKVDDTALGNVTGFSYGTELPANAPDGTVFFLIGD